MISLRFSEKIITCPMEKDLGINIQEVAKSKQIRRVSSAATSLVRASEKRNLNVAQPISLRLRRIRHSDNISTKNHMLSKEKNNFIKKRASTVCDEMDPINGKDNVTKELWKLNDILTECLKDPSMGIKLDTKSNPVSLTTAKGKYSSDSIIVIMQLLRHSVELEIYGVFNDHGKWVSMQTILKKISKLRTHNPSFGCLMNAGSLKLLKRTRNFHVDQKVISVNRGQIQNLSLPREAEKFTENDQRIISLLQRLYPQGKPENGLVDPVKLLLAYPKYVSTKRLFELVQFLLESSDEHVPSIQKQRLFCFCRIWISRGYHMDEIQKESPHESLGRIVNIGLYSENPVTRDLADDLSRLMMNAPLSIKKSSFLSGELSSEQLMDDLDKNNTNETVELFAKDIYSMSQGLFLNIPLSEMLQEPNETVYQKAFANRFNQLAHFVKHTVLSPIASQPNDEGREKVSLRITFWIKVADALKKRGDFHSAMAIVSALNTFEINRLFCPATGKKALSKCKNISQNTLKKWKKMEAMFCPMGGHAAMRDEIIRRKAKDLPVIPYTGIFLSQFVHTMDSSPDLIGEGINLEKFDSIARLLRGLWKDLSFQRNERKSQRSKISLETDLCEQIEEAHRDFEDDPSEFFEELSFLVRPRG